MPSVDHLERQRTCSLAPLREVQRVRSPPSPRAAAAVQAEAAALASILALCAVVGLHTRVPVFSSERRRERTCRQLPPVSCCRACDEAVPWHLQTSADSAACKVRELLTVSCSTRSASSPCRPSAATPSCPRRRLPTTPPTRRLATILRFVLHTCVDKSTLTCHAHGATLPNEHSSSA